MKWNIGNDENTCREDACGVERTDAKRVFMTQAMQLFNVHQLELLLMRSTKK